MIEHCISAFSESERKKSYHLYVAECMRILTENTARLTGGEAKYISVSFCDLIRPKAVDERSGEEIAKDIFDRAGIEVRD